MAQVGEEYVVPIGADGSNFIHTLDAMLGKMDVVEKKAEKSNGVLKVTYQTAAASAGVTDAAIVKLTTAIGTQSAAITALAQHVDKLNNSEKQVTDTTAKHGEAVKGVVAAHKHHVDVLNEVENGFRRVIERVAEYATVYGIIRLVTELVKGTVEAGIEAEVIYRKLGGTLSVLGKGNTFEGIKRSVEDLQRTFVVFSKVDITSVFDKLITFGKLSKQQIDEITPVILNYAAKTGTAVTESADIVLSAIEGQGRGLKRLGINVKDAKSEFDRFNLVVDQLGGKVRGAAEAFGDTIQGKIIATKNRFHELQEEIGVKALPAINAALTDINNTLEDMQGEGLTLGQIFDNAALRVQAFATGGFKALSAMSEALRSARAGQISGQTTPISEQGTFTNPFPNANLFPGVSQLNIAPASEGAGAPSTLSKVNKEEDKERARELKEQQRDAETAARERDKANQDRLREESRTGDLLFKLHQEQGKLEANAIQDDFKRQIALIKAGTEDEIQVIKKQVRDSNEARRDVGLKPSIEVAEQANKIILDIEEKGHREQLKAYKDFAEKRFAIEQQVGKILDGFIDDERARAALKIEDDFKATVDQLNKLLPATGNENVAKFNAALIAADAFRQTQQQKSKQKFDIDDIKREQEHQKTLLEIQFDAIDQGADAERLKRIAIAKIDLEFAEKELKAIADQDSKEYKLQADFVERLKINLKGTINAATSNTFDFFTDVLGLSDAKAEKFALAEQKALELVHSFADSADIIFSTLLDSKQALIDKDNERIDNLEKQFDREKTLSDKGLANNLSYTNKQLQIAKAARDKDLADQKRLARELKILQEAAFIADTIVQGQALATAIANIIKKNSLKPGAVFLDIIEIAATVAEFGAGRVAALAAINQSTKKFAEGGEVTGRRHSEGGEIIEAEHGEYVVRQRSTKKYRSVVEALNKDDFSRVDINDAGFKNMLHGMGISLADEMVAKSVSSANSAYNHQSIIVNSSSGDRYLRNIDESTRLLADKERNREEVLYEDAHMRIVRTGNITRRINK